MRFITESTFTLLILIVGYAGFFTSNSLASSNSNKEHHVALEPYPGSEMSRRDDNGFTSQNLVIGFNSKGKTDAELFKVLPVQGVTTLMSFENPRERSHLEIYQNYKLALSTAGYEILYSCGGKECGPSYIRSGWQRATGMKYFSPEKQFLTTKSVKDGQAIYISLVVAKLRHQVLIVEAGQMELGLVTATSLIEGLSTNGRVVLDGLFFDHNEAALLSESDEALQTIAKFLQENAELNVYIVGHTDLSGSLDYNMNLSRSRAKAVVDALVERYEISRSRLSPQGVGPLSPASTNAIESGQSLNRRVEMVER